MTCGTNPCERSDGLQADLDDARKRIQHLEDALVTVQALTWHHRDELRTTEPTPAAVHDMLTEILRELQAVGK